MPSKRDYFSEPIQHIDVTQHNTVPLVDAMRSMAFTARDLARAADIFDRMLRDRDCGVILCLAGSLISAGLKKVFVEMIRCNMADAIVSTGANIVDQDFFEALGFRHYIAQDRFKSGLHDNELLDLSIDRIYDTLIDEEELRVCDDTVRQIADSVEPRPYSSREFLIEMGAHLERAGAKTQDSIVLEAYRKQVPIFCPAFSDSSAGFGLIAHQHSRGDKAKVSIDSAKDFLELALWKTRLPNTGLFMVGGGVPKNFAQDITVAADILGFEANMHQYAIQVTVADVRDGGLSGSTLKEANSWGKVETTYEQMVYCEATLAVPLLVSYAYHKGSWRTRQARQGNRMLDAVAAR
jgi:deoxyhypusine synthase